MWSSTSCYCVTLGGNSLRLMKGKALVIQVKADLAEILSRWPGVQVVFSAILPCIVWHSLGNTRCLDKAHRNTNCQLQNAVEDGLHLFLMHRMDQVFKPV